MTNKSETQPITTPNKEVQVLAAPDGRVKYFMYQSFASYLGCVTILNELGCAGEVAVRDAVQQAIWLQMPGGSAATAAMVSGMGTREDPFVVSVRLNFDAICAMAAQGHGDPANTRLAWFVRAMNTNQPNEAGSFGVPPMAAFPFSHTAVVENMAIIEQAAASMITAAQLPPIKSGEPDPFVQQRDVAWARNILEAGLLNPRRTTLRYDVMRRFEALKSAIQFKTMTGQTHLKVLARQLEAPNVYGDWVMLIDTSPDTAATDGTRRVFEARELGDTDDPYGVFFDSVFELPALNNNERLYHVDRRWIAQFNLQSSIGGYSIAVQIRPGPNSPGTHVYLSYRHVFDAENDLARLTELCAPFVSS